MTAAFPLVLVSTEILSSYDAKGDTGGPRAELVPLRARVGGAVAHDAAPALLAFCDAILAKGGDPRVTDAHRSADTQAKGRRRYETWIAAGKPKPGTSAFDKVTMKAAFVSVPGKSGHNAGRSVDLDVGSVRFPGVAADRQLDVLWECALATGWTPILRAPTEGAAESWHFDMRGELSGIHDRLGYESWALAGALLVGHAGAWQSDVRVVQALLHRVGEDVGAIDGILGPRTTRGVVARLGLVVADADRTLRTAPGTLIAPLAALPPG